MKEKSPFSIRLETELAKRLEACSAKTKIKKHSLALLAIEAAIEAIERNDYRLVVPIEFEVSDVPISKKSSRAPASDYPKPGTSRAELNEPKR